MNALSLDADALLANLPHTRPVEIQTELDRKTAEHDSTDYTPEERASLLGIGGGW
jgi:hypothetical protein